MTVSAGVPTTPYAQRLSAMACIRLNFRVRGFTPRINEPAYVAPGLRVLALEGALSGASSRDQCLPGWNQRLLVYKAARRFPSHRTGAVGRPDRIGTSPEGDVSRSRSLPQPGGLFLVTIRIAPRGELPLLHTSGRDGVPSALRDGSLPRLPRNLRPDSPREVSTKS
jgi:hypothetical protein